ncbi:conjugal transfer protein TraO [Trinickia dabaoshanensis]|uniref:Conjugal transfer protein TraO n=1 Tax=Trinickia dabaoshanensis TaxID=564714 RepID=A0A2N7VIW4_9BURK|nr:DotG/IcmE/VirB10 family protein [Trinickia dabaoshanensis]PMS17091.1 conjugal transfer protein TraO [Trinickia dabaoshanensis]
MTEQRRQLHPGFLRNVKVIAIIAVLAAVSIGVAFVAMKRRPDKAPEMNVPSVTAQGGTPQAETPRYTQTLNRANQEGLAQAQKTGETFIPAFSDRNAQIEKVLEQRTEGAAQVQKIDYQHPNGLPPGQSAPTAQPLPSLPSPTQGVGMQVQQLVNQWDTPPQSQEVLGLQKEAQAAASATAALGSPGTSTSPQAVAAAQTKPATIHASDRYYAHLENSIDTDTPSDVLAVLDQGPCQGAELMGNGKLTGEAVTASFTSMRCGGKTVPVTAVALNDQTLSNALPADMDHHLVARVAVPALLGALGAAGSVYSNAGSTITQNPLGGTTSIQNPNPSAHQLEGAAVSGGMTGVQGVIQREVAAVPPLTGHVGANTSLVILFKADVVL